MSERNQGEVLFGNVKLEDREYVASELIPIVGRNKRRIQSLCEDLDLGKLTQPVGSGCPVRVLAKRDVEKILKWFDAHGRRHFDAGWTKARKAEQRRNPRKLR